MRRGARSTIVGTVVALAALASATAAQGAWHELVGGPSPVNHGAGGEANHPSLITISGVAWVAWSEHDGTSEKVRVAKLNAAGTDWVEVGAALNHTPSAGAQEPSLAAIGGIPHVAWIEGDGVNFEARVAKLNAAGTGWDELVGGASPINHDATKSATGVSLADVGGVAHVAWSEDIGSSINKAQLWVSRLNGAGTAWTQVGGSSPLNYDPNEQANTPSLASIGGVPYVAWSEGYGDGDIHVAKLNGAGTAWTLLGAGASPINHDPARHASEPDLIGIGGVAHVAWREEDGSDGEIRVSKLNAGETAWNEVVGGTDPISDQGGQWPSLGSIAGIPYVARSEGFPFEVRVSKLNVPGTAWEEVDSATSPVNRDYDEDGVRPDLAVSGGTPLVAWSQSELPSQQIRVAANDDPSIGFSSATYSVSEAAASATINVQRAAGAGVATIDYASANGTAEQPGDYTAASGTLTFAGGETSKTFTVPIINDTDPETDETVQLTLSNPGGTGTLGTPATATLTIADDDTVDTQITSGPSGPTNDNTPTFEFTATKPGATFTCAFNLAPPNSCTSPFTPSTPLGDGTHTFVVTASAPGAGTDPTPAFRTFVVDTKPPTTSIVITAAPGLGQALGNGRFAGAVQITGQANDPAPSSGTSGSRCALDPATPPTVYTDMTQPCPAGVPWTATPSPGQHIVYSASRDPAGNDGPIVSTTFTIVAPPNTTITAGPSAVSWTKTPTFEFTSDTPGSTFKCRVDGAPVNCASPYTVTTPLSPGGHRFQVAAVGPDGAEDATPAERLFSIGRQETHAYSCLVSPFHLHPYPASSQFVDGCRIVPTGQPCAATYDNNCAFAGERCPTGAECSLIQTTDFSDADPDNVDWIVQGQARLSPADRFRDIGGPNSTGVTCSPRRGPAHQCSSTSPPITIIGAGEAPSASCGAVSALTLVIGVPLTFGPDAQRQQSCRLTFTIKPAVAGNVVATGTAGSAYAPGAGALTVAPGGGSSKAAKASSAAKLPSAAKTKPAFKTIRRKVNKAGAVTFKFKLSKVLAKTYKRKGKVKISLVSTFKPKKRGAKTITRKQKLTLVAPGEAPETPLP
jgi:hypothetical protein